MNSSDRLKKIETKLIATLQPNKLILTDESHLHVGHEGAKDGRGHFSLEISSPTFKDKSLIACHRMIYDTLGQLMQTEIHALSIKIDFNEYSK